MSNTYKFLFHFVAGLGIVVAASGANAETITMSDQSQLLSELLGGGSIMVGDKTFSNFGYAETGDMPPATGVNVIPIVQDGNYGLRFQGGFIDTDGGGASDSLITFTVSAPAAWIKGATLAANVDATNGVASIVETFLPEHTTTSMSVTSGVNLAAAVEFDAPVQTLNVQKDILLLAQGAPATLSFVDQTFPQVPEPGTGLMLMAGLVGLTSLRRRR